jgi:uncharacterized protein YbcI
MAISNRMVRMIAEYLGRGPTRVRTTLTTNIAVVTLGEPMTRGEQHLVAAGESGAVHSMRDTFHRSMREEAMRAVAEITGKSVIAYLADLDTESNIGMIAFVFERRPESLEVDVAESGPPTEGTA